MKAPGAARATAFAVILHLLASCATAPPPRPAPPVTPVVHTGPVWPRPEIVKLASTAYRCAERDGHYFRPVLTIIDYSLPSTARRLWVIDVLRNRILRHERVAHGEGSGRTMAVAFSNQTGSHQSSLGLFRTDEVYNGRFGYSLRLSGLEPAINDRARERAIVIHGSSDVSDSFLAQWGTIGNSWGCPAVAAEVAPQIIDLIAGGSAIFAYYPDPKWLRESRYLHCADRPGSLASTGGAPQQPNVYEENARRVRARAIEITHEQTSESTTPY